MRPIGSQYLAIIGNESMEYEIYAVNKRNIEGTNEHLWPRCRNTRNAEPGTPKQDYAKFHREAFP